MQRRGLEPSQAKRIVGAVGPRGAHDCLGGLGRLAEDLLHRLALRELIDVLGTVVGRGLGVDERPRLDDRNLAASDILAALE